MHDFLRLVTAMAVWLGSGFAVLLIALAIMDIWEPHARPDMLSWRIVFWPVPVLLAWIGLKDAATGSIERGKRMKQAEDRESKRRARVKQFRTAREAKEYLANRIIAQAELEEAPLTEIERKMLYFTESGWTLPDMLQVNVEFERDYNEQEYEKRIAGLASRIQAHNAAEDDDEHERWDLAVEKLSARDHYILVLIGGSQLSAMPRPLWLRVLVLVIGFALLALLQGWSKEWLRSH